jgi:macrolide-specific efflux system membrane fusion protein
MRFGLIATTALAILSTAMLAAVAQQRRALPLHGETPMRGEAPVRGDVEVVSNCLITLIDEAEVPAQEEGTILEIAVREGQQVTKGDLLAQIDDEKVRMAENVARYELEAAKAESGNDVNVRYARSAAEVAAADYQQVVDANQRAPKSYPIAEVRKLLLDHRKFILQIEQSEHELNLASLTAKVKEAQLAAASTDVDRRKVKAPIDGMVIKRYRRVGEWVRPGEPVLRLVGTDHLRIEGYLDATRISPADVAGQPVSITVAMPHGGQETFAGKVVFVSPLVEAGMQFLVHAEVANRQQNGSPLLRPGLPADMKIQLKK